MTDTSGFYRWNETTLELEYGQADIYGPGYELYRDQHETYTYPNNGWWWFDTRVEARAALLGAEYTGRLDPLEIEAVTEAVTQIQDQQVRDALTALVAALQPLVGTA